MRFTQDGGHGDPVYLELLDELRELHLEKSAGYGTPAEPLANFIAVADARDEPHFVYPIDRMTEKLARCRSLIAQGRLEELGEELPDMASLLLCAEVLRRRSTTGG